ncbi:ATP-binding cassette domain-containing protein [Aliiroseovarius sp. S1339]|uniref:ATP-binding cassette domain-containing protein n=1 Tax=Aliiroseovarius sp. S1339 TaxID=2936990 RepID=UPI0020C06A7A|nr:ATP-binding cassette domain-containing protein [Aliiroseovarius sp. S1339]MCK8465134.1 ATP-binding cassette domain-containing protein [Aliiroseovarius sp. S1339]
MAKGLHLNKVKITHSGQPLMSINTHVAPGEVVTIMGPSGVGKSTLLSAIIGTLSPDFALSGQIHLNGRDLTTLPPDERCVGILFQDALLFPHLNVGANLAFGLAQGGTKADRRARINAALAEVGLGGFANRDPATLSGGQRARVALMRMLLSEPHALLLDEPFSGLDAELRGQVRQLVFDHAKARALPVLLVTHDAEDAEATGGPIIRLD